MIAMAHGLDGLEFQKNYGNYAYLVDRWVSSSKRIKNGALITSPSKKGSAFCILLRFISCTNVPKYLRIYVSL